jgi:hypothetical protein
MDDWAWEQLTPWLTKRVELQLLGHTNLGITSIYLEGIDSTEIIDTVHARRASHPALLVVVRSEKPAGNSWDACIRRAAAVWSRR